MKKRIISTFIIVFAALCLCINSYGAYELTCGLEILKSKVEVKKCGTLNTAVEFEQDDFDGIIGKADYITIMTLPEKATGRLVLGGKELAAGQTITRRSLSSVSFIPQENLCAKASFTFKNASSSGNSYGVCTIYILEKPNHAPISKDFNLEALKNISYKGFLCANDSDGDSLTYSIVSGARHGTVRLIDKASGHFMYTPNVDFTGRDIFTFKAKDAFGNISAASKVTIHVNEPQVGTVYHDMTNHWAHSYAIEAMCDGVLTGTIVDDKNLFFPNSHVSRGDFLAIAMIAAHLEQSVAKTQRTSFYDDENIPINIKSYAQTALGLGVINGYIDGERLIFDSEKSITRGEAEAIISRLIAITQNGMNKQTNNASVTADGSKSIAYQCGIMVGNGYDAIPDSRPLTKAQAAKLYCSLKEYFKNQ